MSLSFFTLPILQNKHESQNMFISNQGFPASDLAMAMSKGKSRLTADPSIGVSDLLSCLESFLDTCGDNNLQKHIEPPAGLWWKTSPHPAWLAKLQVLWKQYLTIAPNGLIPGKRHRDSLEKLVDRRKIHTGQRTAEEFAERCDEWIRIGLAHLRDIHKSSINKQRCLRKAAPDEQEALEHVLSMMAFSEVQEESCTTVVSYTAPTTVAAASMESNERTKTTLVPKDPMDIFQMVLERPDIDTTTSKNTKKSPNRKQRSSGSTSFRLEGFNGFLDGLMALDGVDGNDADLLDACKHQKPINHNCTSQLQRANKAKKKQAEETEEDETQPQKTTAKPTKAKSKAKAKAKAKTLPKAQTQQCAKQKTNESKDAATETHEGLEDQQDVVPAPKKTPVKTEGDGNGKKIKKGKKMATGNSGIKKKKSKKKTSKKKQGPVENKDDGEKEDKTDELPAGFDPKASRAINRKRYTSRAWHKAFVASKAEGMDDEQAKAKARIASQAASTEFVQLWPNNDTVFDLQ